MVFGADAEIGESMERVNQGTGPNEVLMTMTITEDDVTATQSWSDRTGSPAKRP